MADEEQNNEGRRPENRLLPRFRTFKPGRAARLDGMVPPKLLVFRFSDVSAES